MTRTIRQTDSLSDHYTIISRDSAGQTSRVVIAASSADAVETHRAHYPTGAIIRIVRS